MRERDGQNQSIRLSESADEQKGLVVELCAVAGDAFLEGLADQVERLLAVFLEFGFEAG